jgi:cation diffusion facilitator family transporter
VMTSVSAVEGGSRKAIFAALAANAGIAVSKLVGFLLTGAASLAAEAVHSFADTTNQLLLLLGGRRAGRGQTEMYAFGHGRERYFWAFVVALVLFMLGGVFAIVEGVDKLRHPHEVDSFGLALGILLVAVALETYSLATAVREARPLRRGASWWRFIRHSRNPELPVVLLEDTGAEIGLLLALGGVITAHVTGDARWDAAGSLGIGVLLVLIACTLVVEMKSLLIGESATSTDVDTLRAAVESTPNVRKLIHMRTQHLGPDELLVCAKLEMESSLSFADVAATINAAEDRLRAAVPIARIIYLEPDCAR